MTGATIACAHCGREKYLPPSRASRRFCSRQCWGLYRWKHRLGVAVLETLTPRARRAWKLRWTKSPGRKRTYTPEQERWVLNLAAQGYGHDRIAERIGMHRDTVRRIRGRQARS